MTQNLLILLIAFKCVIFANSLQNDEVKRYVDLIQAGIKASNPKNGPKNAKEYIPNSKEITEFGQFDYIVVGAGSAGPVVANRLSANPCRKVLLIEAGGYQNEFSTIPAFHGSLFNSEYTWSFKTRRQSDYCLGMVNQQCNQPMGRGMGGGTIIGGLNYNRGNKLDYDSWEKQGNPGWSYKDVLPLFLKSENASFDFGDSPYHRRGGELNVEYAHPNKAPYQAFVQANIELGHPLIDYNGQSQIGVGRPQFNTIDGRRDSSSRAFLEPIFKRKNLKIMTYSYATKINIHKSTKTAYGVTFSHNKTLYLARANREIILSAGSFQTPQLLMLSGIGPANDLKSLDIPLVQNLSVGANLQEHGALLATFFKVNVTYPEYTLEEQVKQYLQGYGDLTFTYNSEGISWFKTKFDNISNIPDIEIMLMTIDVTTENFKLRFNFDDKTFKSVYANIDPTNTFLMVPITLFHRTPSAAVYLESANPYELPRVKFQSDKREFEFMYEGIEIILKLINTNAFKKLNATLIDTSHPNCKHNYKYLSREYWMCQMQHLSFDLSHKIGSCKMGPDPIVGGAVVNHKLQVYGINKLRVADASIIPNLHGSPTAAAMMIGEKVSELILSGN